VDRDVIENGASRRRARLSLATGIAISGLTPWAALYRVPRYGNS
jgi:hypothetical protein